MLRTLPCYVAAMLVINTPVWAEPRCSDRIISASGAPGRIHFTGRRNARLAWSAKVRSELGEAYASWGRAWNRRFNCTYENWRYRCSAAAMPCRSIVPGRL